MRVDSGFERLLIVSLAIALIFVLPAIASAQTRSLYMPAVHVTGGTDSMLALTNSGSVAATVTLIARSYDGATIRGSRLNPVTVSVPPQNSSVIRPKDLFGEIM